MVIKFNFIDIFFRKRAFIKLGTKILDKKIMLLNWVGKKNGAWKSNSGMSTACDLCQMIKPEMQRGVRHKCTTVKNQVKIYFYSTYERKAERGAELGSI